MSVGIGRALTEARQARGLEVADAHQVTKIRARYLQALEEEEWDAIPGPAYVRGFLQSYAEFLGLDPDPLLSKLAGERIEPAEDLLDPIIQPGALSVAQRMNFGWATLAAALVVIIALVLVLGGGDDAPQRSEPGERGGQPAKRGGEKAAPRGSEKRAQTTQPASPEPDIVSLRLRATGDVWVCLVDHRDRELIAAETLSAGERRGPFEGRRFLLTLGNGQLRLRANDEVIEVPDASEPIGLRIGARGARDLAAAERPECA